MWPRRSIACLAIVGSLGCSSGGSGGSSDAANLSDRAGGTGSTTDSAGSDDAISAGDLDARPRGDAGRCNQVANVADTVVLDERPGELPALKGGNVVPGTYVLTSARAFVPPKGSITSVKWTMSVTATSLLTVQGPPDRPEEVHYDWTYSTEAARLRVRETCPSSIGVEGYTFEATPDSLTLGYSGASSSALYVFTKR